MKASIEKEVVGHQIVKGSYSENKDELDKSGRSTYGK